MKTKSTFTIIFFTRKSRSNSKQLSFYVRITVNGKRSEMSLKRSIAQIQWDNAKNRGRGNSETARILNAYLYGFITNCSNVIKNSWKKIKYYPPKLSNQDIWEKMIIAKP